MPINDAEYRWLVSQKEWMLLGWVAGGFGYERPVMLATIDGVEFYAQLKALSRVRDLSTGELRYWWRETGALDHYRFAHAFDHLYGSLKCVGLGLLWLFERVRLKVVSRCRSKIRCILSHLPKKYRG